jgi:hypothetical protein
VALSYDEIREWAVILGAFTASDLARAMGVADEIGQRAVTALCTQGMCVNTGDMLDGPSGYEPVIEYVPPPPGPTSYDGGPDPVAQSVDARRAPDAQKPRACLPAPRGRSREAPPGTTDQRTERTEIQTQEKEVTNGGRLMAGHLGFILGNAGSSPAPRL